MTRRATGYVGWLLRANRLFGPDRQLRSGREFARVFRRDGEKGLAPSQITRWESGQLAPSHATMRRYEHLLGIAPGFLVGISDLLCRLDGQSTGSFEVGKERTVDDCGLHDMLDRACTPGAMTGTDWDLLTEWITLRPDLVLHPPTLWRAIADQLLAELSVSTYGPWLQRHEAMCRLLEHPCARRYAAEACVAMAIDPASPVVIEPMSLLRFAADAESNRFIVGQIADSGDGRTLHGALLAAMGKASQHHFDESQQSLLLRHVVGRLKDPSADPTVLPLLAELGQCLGRRHSDGAVRRAIRRHCDIDSSGPTESGQSSHLVSEQVTALAIGRLAEDTIADSVLSSMVQECLFSPNPDRRLIVGMLVGATPYREPVAHAVLLGFLQSVSRRDGTYPLAALRLLTNLNVDIHRQTLHHILAGAGFAATLRHAAAWAAPHCPGRDPAAVWRTSLAAAEGAWKRNPTSLNEDIVLGVVYSIGTDSHSGLLREVRDRADSPSSARIAASWLLQSRATPDATGMVAASDRNRSAATAAHSDS